MNGVRLLDFTIRRNWYLTRILLRNRNMLHKTVNVLAVVCLLLFSNASSADYVKPSQNVLALIVAIKNNDLRGVANNADLIAIANQPKHPYSLNQLLELFKNVSVSEISIIDLVGNDYVTKVRVSGSINLDFELEIILNQSKPNKTYRVVGIHP